jgi:hypothetical protein
MSVGAKVNVEKLNTKEASMEKLPPFGVIMVWGAKGSGKTWFGLSSPYKPVLALDCENSSKAYKAAGLFDFDRKECLDWETFRNTVKAIPEKKYGTILVDTAGQAGAWIEQYEFKKAGPKAETQSMLIWGEVRDTFRELIISLMKKAPMIILTAHARVDYMAARRKEVKFQERVNGAFLELCDLSMQLVREPNERT